MPPPIGTSNPASAVDLAQQLAAVEARAVAAEDQLARDRHDHAERVREMEGKLRDLDPWIRKLRGEYQQTVDERDALRKQLSVETGSVADGVRAEIVALSAERDSALADVAALTTQLEADTADLDRRWTRRVEVIEAAREEAVTKLVAAERVATESRQGADEVRGLTTELDSARQTVAAHKAVARAAQEEAAVLKERAELLESTQSELSSLHEKKVREAERLTEKLDSRTRDLKAAKASAEETRDELATTRARVDELDEATAALKGEAAAVAVVREQAEEARHEIEKLRAETAEAKQALAKLDEESAFARRSVESVREELKSTAKERAAAHTQSERLSGELEEARERAARAEEAVAESLADSETSATRLGCLEAEQRESVARISDLEEDLSAANAQCAEADAVAADAREFEKLRSEVECGRTAIATLQSRNDALNEEVESLRTASQERSAVTEAGHESQLEAVRARAEAEMTGLRARVEQSEALLGEFQAKLSSNADTRETEMRHIRVGVCAALGEGMQRLLDGMEHVLGPDLALPGPGTGGVPPDAEPKWDVLLSELEELRGEVEGFREVDPAAVAQAEITASIEIDVLPGVDVPTMTDPVVAEDVVDA